MRVPSDRIILERLDWLERAMDGLTLLLGEDTLPVNAQIKRCTDPLKYLLTIPLGVPIPQGSRHPFRRYLRSWGYLRNCDMPRINIMNHCIQAEILIKHRHWKHDDLDD